MRCRHLNLYFPLPPVAVAVMLCIPPLSRKASPLSVTGNGVVILLNEGRDGAVGWGASPLHAARIDRAAHTNRLRWKRNMNRLNYGIGGLLIFAVASAASRPLLRHRRALLRQ